MIQLVGDAMKAAKQPTAKYHIHLFFLATALAHLICRSIRLILVGPGHMGDWKWEAEYFGGHVERVFAPNPYTRVSVERKGGLMKRVKLHR